MLLNWGYFTIPKSSRNSVSNLSFNDDIFDVFDLDKDVFCIFDP